MHVTINDQSSAELMFNVMYFMPSLNKFSILILHYLMFWFLCYLMSAYFIHMLIQRYSLRNDSIKFHLWF